MGRNYEFLIYQCKNRLLFAKITTGNILHKQKTEPANNAEILSMLAGAYLEKSNGLLSLSKASRRKPLTSQVHYKKLCSKGCNRRINHGWQTSALFTAFPRAEWCSHVALFSSSHQLAPPLSTFYSSDVGDVMSVSGSCPNTLSLLGVGGRERERERRLLHGLSKK